MTSKIIVNSIEADTGISSITFASNINLQNDASVFASSNGVRLGTGSTIAAPSANEITLSTNGTERVRVDSSGNVGIGTEVPTAKLEVVGKSICGVVFDKTNYSNVLNTATNTGTAGFRTLNLIDESAVVKLARLHPDYGPALDLQHWSTDISTLYGRALIGINSANTYINNLNEDGYIYFNTRESGVGVSSERVRITSIGLVGIGTDNPA